MPFVALTVAAAALRARSLNVSVANLIGRRYARTTKALQLFESSVEGRAVNAIGQKRQSYHRWVATSPILG